MFERSCKQKFEARAGPGLCYSKCCERKPADSQQAWAPGCWGFLYEGPFGFNNQVEDCLNCDKFLKKEAFNGH